MSWNSGTLCLSPSVWHAAGSSASATAANPQTGAHSGAPLKLNVPARAIEFWVSR